MGHRWLRHLAECIVASMHIWGTSSADLHHRGCDCPIAPYDSHSMTMWSSSISAVHFNSACTERLRTDHVTRPCCLFTRWASRHQHDSDGGDLSSQLNALQTHTLNARFKRRPFCESVEQTQIQTQFQTQFQTLRPAAGLEILQTLAFDRDIHSNAGSSATLKRCVYQTLKRQTQVKRPFKSH